MTCQPSPKVSILVPCYNVKDYVEQCLESLRNQTLRDIEVIMINDGSSDGTLDILLHYRALDPRFKLIDKKNSGYGDSMNKGLELATGEFIGILESDDFADLRMYEVLYDYCKINNLDFCRSAFYVHCDGEDVKTVSFDKFEKYQVVSPRKCTRAFLLNPNIWSCLFNRQWLRDNKISFLPTPGASFQDVSFAFKANACADRFMMIQEAFVHYRQFRDGNSMTSSGKEYCVCTEVKEVFRFAKSLPNSEEVLECANFLRMRLYKNNVHRFSKLTLPEFIRYWSEENAELKRKGLFKKKLFKGTDNRLEFMVSYIPTLAIAYLTFKYRKSMTKDKI